jgi:hypothetical protein
LSKKFRNYYFVLFFGGVSFLFHFIIEWKNGSAPVVDDVGIFHQRLLSDIQHAREGGEGKIDLFTLLEPTRDFY